MNASKVVLSVLGVLVVIGLIYFIVQRNDDVPDDSSDETAEETNGTQNGQQQTPTGSSSYNSVTLAENRSGESVTVASATLAQPGYVVIYRAVPNGEVVATGHSSLLAAGTYTDLEIDITGIVQRDEVIIALVQTDDGDGVFDSAGSDLSLFEEGVLIADVDVINVPPEEEQRFIDEAVERFLEAQAEAAEGPLEIELTAENYSFSSDEISIPVGRTVRLTLTSSEGLHDFVVDEIEGAQTDRVTSGASETIEFIATEPGTYDFYCSIADHRTRGMEGTITVTAE